VATYKEAGVDLAAADNVVDEIADAVTATWTRGVAGGFGGFAAGITLPKGYRSPVLMMSTDGVGTKAEVALRAGRLDGVGYDLVAMCIDDLAAVGATPIAMTDYIAIDHIDVDRVATLVRSIAAACVSADVALLGGETAEHPGVMPDNSFDLAGTALGVVEAGDEVTGDAIAAGNIILGLESPNLRSNGFSFVRAHLLTRFELEDRFPGTDMSVAEVVLEPSVIYAPAIRALVAELPVAGMAHVTGGGLPGNLARILPPHLDARIETSSWVTPPVFSTLAELTKADPAELYATFNMGVGFIVIVAPGDAAAATQSLKRNRISVSVIGEIMPGNGTVLLV
jgi:phosphoribosylformylglycinamidine cyclo-ligase